MRSRKNNTTLTRKVDKWNTRKVWLIKRYADGHYAINQEVGGRVFYSRFQRATKAQIAAIFAFLLDGPEPLRRHLGLSEADTYITKHDIDDLVTVVRIIREEAPAWQH